jgi:ketosteroid isomerase-like protein
MKHHFVWIGLMLLLLAIPVCAQTLTDAQKAEIQKVVKEQEVQFFRSLETMDVAAIERFWSRENSIGQVLSGRLTTSLEGMAENRKNAFAIRRAHKFDIQDVTVHVFSPDYAMAILKATQQIEYKNGDVGNYSYVASTVWVREGTGWKVALTADSSLVK